MLGANLEAEDSDGDTALHLVLLQMKNNRGLMTTHSFLLNILFRAEPNNITDAPTINKARLILCFTVYNVSFTDYYITIITTTAAGVVVTIFLLILIKCV